jgi:steroid delta-isomerase-like uncharacterized protein
MSTDANKQLVRRFVRECVNLHRAEQLTDFVGPDLRVHPGTPGSAPDTEGVDELRTAFERFRTTFPDLEVTLEDVIAEGDLVAARWTARGTQRGPFADLPPTGASVSWSGTDVYRLSDGRIVEWWRNDDVVWLLHQLGRDLLPSS